jgi:hypothetical protein
MTHGSSPRHTAIHFATRSTNPKAASHRAIGHLIVATARAVTGGIGRKATNRPRATGEVVPHPIDGTGIVESSRWLIDGIARPATGEIGQRAIGGTSPKATGRVEPEGTGAIGPRRTGGIGRKANDVKARRAIGKIVHKATGVSGHRAIDGSDRKVSGESNPSRIGAIGRRSPGRIDRP